MPVILKPKARPAWLGEEPADERSSRRCWPPTLPMAICWPVSARVGNLRNSTSSLIEAVAAA